MYSFTPYPIIPIGNFIGLILALLPLLSNIRKLSFAVWGNAIWIATFNFQMFVNSIIWHNNVNIVVPVWCDIVTKLQTGAQIGTRTCTLVISIHLFKIMRPRGKREERERRAIIRDLSMIVGLPLVIMALWITIQPFRFEIIEEAGCFTTSYSYVTYILLYVPSLISDVACLSLNLLILRTVFQHRREMKKFLCDGQDVTNRCYRVMAVTYLDGLVNLFVTITSLCMTITRGTDNIVNHPYVSWSAVHDGAGGNAPGLSISSILQVPASVWSTDKWFSFTVKWNEWIYTIHALVFFCAFGTTPEMRSYYRAAFWFIPGFLGYKSKTSRSEVETLSDVAFNSNPNQRSGDRSTSNGLRGSLSFLDTAIDLASVTRSEPASDLESTTSRFDIETISKTEEGGGEKMEVVGE